MKIKYVSKSDFLMTRHDQGIHVVVVHDIALVERFLKKNGVKMHAELLLGKVVLIEKMTVVFYVMPEEEWYIEMQSICKSLQSELVVLKKDKKVIQDTFYLFVDKLKFKQKRAFLLCLFKEMYQFKKYKHTAVDARSLYIIDKEKGRRNILDIINHANAGSLARDIATEPSNKMWPERFCEHVRAEFKGCKEISVRCMSMQDMKNLNLNLIVSVGQSAHHEPKMMIIEYMPEKNGETVCLVGKGVVFDAGGYNIKPSQSMWGMKGDKTGGAIVVGLFKFLAQMKERPTKNLIGIVPLVENLVSHNASKPGDIVKTYNGVTVEIIDTDAEGRLIMADAFAYLCDKYKPSYIIDFATLTGWSGLMHCDTSYVYYTQDNRISDIVQYIGEHVGERSVRMPVWPEYMRYTRSAVADYKNLQNSCKRSGGFMAAMFLMNFIKPELREKWIHFDITHSEKESLHTCNALATGIDLVFKYLLK